ncbi:DUF6377 domain-containing protein [Draconibacterium sediminis]|uniref:Transcriptional regulator n=1 Tax=Draconibacterium sediminis TaxID=1544798 RepID=A0A0D8J8J9_9BACT|nr:DUF6377 domain-containing protein [Draconibacterium sediminis]KJF42821.1 transcriptional regulator [Draconibacterium sediminis]
MKFFRLFICLVFLYPGAVLGQSPLDSLLNRLDAAIENHKVYQQQKEDRIQALKNQLRTVSPNTIEEYRLNAKLYDEYRPYICDSAIHYKNRNIDVAKHLDNTALLYESELNLAYLMASTGMYLEAVDLISSIEKEKVPDNLLSEYYDTYRHVYSELAFYTQNKKGAERYWQISNRYTDSLYNVLSSTNDLYYALKEERLRNAGKIEEALSVNDTILANSSMGTREFAIASYNRSLTYRRIKDTDRLKYYLAQSALSDILSATKDHASLWMLAEILFQENDMERAYNYIRFSWSETVFYNARLRSLQSAGILSLIDRTYQATVEKKNRQLQNYLLLSSILGLLLTVALVYIYSQMRRLSETRKYLQKANSSLQNLNTELQKVNDQLQIVNVDLSESNQIKEVYIAHFIKLCSTYIDKMDGFRRLVNKKITNGQVAELHALTRSQEMMDDETEELYRNFDKAFLRIFPHFVEKVNELLLDEEKFELNEEELLNTELRILALIRLGINNSSQIADFLRYSVNTIYNYRAKTKNRAKSRNDFEDMIIQIR